MAAGVEVKPEKQPILTIIGRLQCKGNMPSVGNSKASKLNFFSVPSIPRVRPKSASAARASKNEALTVVASEVMNLPLAKFLVSSNTP